MIHVIIHAFSINAYIPNTLMVLDLFLVICVLSKLDVTDTAQWYITPSSPAVGVNVYVMSLPNTSDLLPLVHSYVMLASANISAPDTAHSKV